jgi:hypothetical protein
MSELTSSSWFSALTSASGSELLSLGGVLMTSSIIRTERLTHTLFLDLEFGSLLLQYQSLQ